MVHCTPKNIRKDQDNCIFYRTFYGVFQYDLKGNNDKTIVLSDEDFNKHFDLL